MDFIIQGFQANYAVLRHERHGEIKWPLEKLPKDFHVGDNVAVHVEDIANIAVSTPKIENKNPQEDAEYHRMRRLLEELIN